MMRFQTRRRWGIAVAAVLLGSSLLEAQAVSETPPVSPVSDGLVLVNGFDRIEGESERFTLARWIGRDEPFRGTLSPEAEVVTTSAGPAVELTGGAHVVYDRPMMIDPAEGTLDLRMALNFDLDDPRASPIVVLWTLYGEDEGQQYMARLYLATLRQGGRLLFGVYNRTERTWLFHLKSEIDWPPDEFHRVRVTWRDKTSLWVDGRIQSTVLSHGLLTRQFPPPAVDITHAQLYLGVRSENQTRQSHCIIDELPIFDRQVRFDRDRDKSRR